VRERLRALDGRLYEVLRPAAEALEEKFPEAASLLYRRMTESVLERGSSKQYPYAARSDSLHASGVPPASHGFDRDPRGIRRATAKGAWMEMQVLGVDRAKGAKSVAKRKTPPIASNDKVQALRERYHCPTPLHALKEQ